MGRSRFVKAGKVKHELSATGSTLARFAGPMLRYVGLPGPSTKHSLRSRRGGGGTGASVASAARTRGTSTEKANAAPATSMILDAAPQLLTKDKMHGPGMSVYAKMMVAVLPRLADLSTVFSGRLTSHNGSMVDCWRKNNNEALPATNSHKVPGNLPRYRQNQ